MHVFDEGDRLGAPVSGTSVDESANQVVATLEDMSLPTSRVLIEHFASRPVVWHEDVVVVA